MTIKNLFEKVLLAYSPTEYNTIRGKEHHAKEEFPELFTDLRRLQQIHLDAGVQPFSIATVPIKQN